jgi:hypothetical protein
MNQRGTTAVYTFGLCVFFLQTLTFGRPNRTEQTDIGGCVGFDFLLLWPDETMETRGEHLHGV